jgi:hypothetical protein
MSITQAKSCVAYPPSRVTCMEAASSSVGTPSTTTALVTRVIAASVLAFPYKARDTPLIAFNTSAYYFPTIALSLLVFCRASL